MNDEKVVITPEARALAAGSVFKRPPKNRKKALILDLIALAIAAPLIYFFAPNPFLFASDFVRNWMTSTPAGIEQLVLNLRLTNKGKFVFGAVNPQIENKTVFNSSCPTVEENASSLGCYNSNTQEVHIYNVESEELAGEIEATAAHELLHAAWDRLSNYDRSRLEPLLLEVYNSDEHHAMLAESTKNYAPAELMTELHSQIAERIKDLPPELEKHYAKYFEDQDLIVSYFNQYSSVFKQLQKEAEALSAEIDEARASVAKQEQEYKTWVDDYNSRVENFNACARDYNCTIDNFNAKLAELITEGKKLDSFYATYSAAVDALNAKIDQFNAGVTHLQVLDRALDSRSSPETNIEVKEN